MVSYGVLMVSHRALMVSGGILMSLVDSSGTAMVTNAFPMAKFHIDHETTIPNGFFSRVPYPIVPTSYNSCGKVRCTRPRHELEPQNGGHSRRLRHRRSRQQRWGGP